MRDALGDRMKEKYENVTRYMLPRRTNTIIRIDGKAFHTYTRKFTKPFDYKIVVAMNTVLMNLCHEICGAKFGYTQSDEISILVTDFDTITTESWFNGNVQKISSVAASLATGYFNSFIGNQPLAFFDARVFTIPDRVEVENYFIWRQKDCIRNAINSAGQHKFGHKALQGKSAKEVKAMLDKSGYEFDPDIYLGRFCKYDGLAWKIDSSDFILQRDVLSKAIPTYPVEEEKQVHPVLNGEC